jgi:tRNA U34 5-carboxymethylaminomethyl modifying enzyme MnmG/GidA
MDFQLLPEDIQFKALSSVAGFEKVKFFRPGYANMIISANTIETYFGNKAY